MQIHNTITTRGNAATPTFARSALILVLGWTAEADAQQVAALSTPDSGIELSEVLVTATKRQTRLQDTPIAISVFTPEQIEGQRLYNFSDIAERAPGLEFIPYSRQEAYVSIRGTTTNSAAAGADLGVTVFIDDVPTIGVGDNDPDLFDLSSIEVLRGPQGTLFGRNVTGGALVVHTLPPSFTLHESAEVTYGTDNLAEIRSYVTGPIDTDTLAGKVAVQYRRQDGIIDNVDLGTGALSTNAGSGRAQLLWTPTGDLKILFGGDFSKDGSPYKTTQLIGNFQPSLLPPLSYSPDNTNEAIRGTGDARNGGGLIRVDFTNPLGILTAITGYRDIDDKNYHSTSGEPANQLLQYATQQGHQFTEEVRLASPEAQQRLTWVGGLFFLNAVRDYGTQYDLDVLPGVVASFASPYKALTFTSISDQHVTSYSYAAFGEAAYALTDAIKLTLGARLTREEKSGHSEVYDTSGLDTPLIAPHYSHSWNAFNPKATLSWQPLPRLLTYLTASTGFKSGGYDTTGTTVAGLETSFKPERVTNYEGGFKWTAPNDRLSLAIAGYYADYKDLQVNEYNQQLLQFVTANAGRSKIPGAEVEAFGKPFEWLTLNASYSYIGADYTSYQAGQADYSGHQIPFDAKDQYHFGGEVHFGVAPLGGGEIKMGADVTYRTKTYFDDQNDTPEFILRNTVIRGLVNAHATWVSARADWQVSLWGKNITDSRYLVVASDLTPFYASPAEYFSPAGNKMFAGDWNPRSMFGLSVTFKQ
jgi:iron complex outermembrane receptor protein